MPYPITRIFEVISFLLGGIVNGLRQDWNLLEIALILAGWFAWKKLNWRPDFRWSWNPPKPFRWAVVIALGAIALRLALLPLMPAPEANVTDEFSHLLLADTLAHGRLTNPAHAFWPHFESLHIIQQPHYSSNYFPGHAALLAAGQVLLNSAWVGVLVECALFLIVLYWALAGWMPARWALFGTLLAALRFGIGSYWINGYHGGFLPALAGGLVAGAFPRLRKQSTMALSAIFGLGVSLLLITRPFEGFAFAAPFSCILVWESRQDLRRLARMAAPTVIVLAATAIGLGIYLKAVTGDPFTTAYHISQKTYGWPMAFPWTTPPKIEHRHVEMQQYYDYEVSEHEKVDGPIDYLQFLTFRAQEYWRFFFGPLLSIPLVLLGRQWRKHKMLFVGLAGAVAAVALEGASSPHYISPATVMLVAVVALGARHLNASRLRIGPLLLAGIAVVLVLRIGAQRLGLPYTQKTNYQSWCCRVEGNRDKIRVTAELNGIAGEHLVFVKTKTDPYNFLQWIYNSADIDSQRIVWARDLGEEKNAKLARYYSARQVWIVDPNVMPAIRTEYPSPLTVSQSQTPPPQPLRQ